ncbi:hypothetical protein DAPPUDRAFT_300640 [Daphnia pulex]|uniref:Mitochondrial inner membrane protease subunit n=1 Tax=Daphnia pulex TaxID=6669 RepID=E9HEB0_DAPPU|nr:hypothetical protein DAPPUDRAFT_300640 [Daphnia pulex]|eukprot:EFX69931.1 hypothetical protein DAPPUDRAFT_300640 [Daphnia pulex]
MIRRILSKGFGVGLCVLQYGCIAHCFVEHVAELVVCSGPSMEPTIYSDDIIISEHITTKFSKYERGDVVILRSPSNPQMFICKRIIGVPGDKIKINCIQHNVVPRGHIWLEGDNKSNSSDSRTYGPVPQGLVRGRALCRIWPLNSIQMLTSNV